MYENVSLATRAEMFDVPPPAEIKRILTAPFGREYLRFKMGAANKYFPYFEGDDLMDRLIEATNNCFDLSIDGTEWRERELVVYGHLSIPGLGRRAGIGMQEHTSKQGNAAGPDLIKGARIDLLKNCLVAFKCGDQVRRMDPLSFNPEDPRQATRLARDLDHYFPRDPSFPSPEKRDAIAEEPRTETAASSATYDLKCTQCTAILKPAQKTFSERKYGQVLCPDCQRRAA